VSLNSTLDPFVRALEQRKNLSPDDSTLFAGVGIDFSNRRRNKLAGSILHSQMKSSEQLHLKLKSVQHLGNWPCKELIAKSSTVFFATRHAPSSATSRPGERDMGLNHRGGAPGFVRVYEDNPHGADKDAYGMSNKSATTTYLVLPDQILPTGICCM